MGLILAPELPLTGAIPCLQMEVTLPPQVLAVIMLRRRVIEKAVPGCQRPVHSELSRAARGQYIWSCPELPEASTFGAIPKRKKKFGSYGHKRFCGPEG